MKYLKCDYYIKIGDKIDEQHKLCPNCYFETDLRMMKSVCVECIRKVISGEESNFQAKEGWIEF